MNAKPKASKLSDCSVSLLENSRHPVSRSSHPSRVLLRHSGELLTLVGNCSHFQNTPTSSPRRRCGSKLCSLCKMSCRANVSAKALLTEGVESSGNDSNTNCGTRETAREDTTGRILRVSTGGIGKPSCNVPSATPLGSASSTSNNPQSCCGDPVNTGNGNYYYQQTDLAIDELHLLHS
jgi:hypothetical protein